MQRQFVPTIIPLLASFLALSVSSWAQFTPAEGIAGENLSARTGPAAVSRDSEDVLKKKGYSLIGTFSSKEQVGQTCWGKGCETSLSCPSGAGGKDLTKTILEQAAARGGDLVVLSADNEMHKDSLSKQGKCTSKGSRQVQGPRLKCRGVSTRICTYEPGWKVEHYCIAWEAVTGNACSVHSVGTVWRLDPGLPGRLATRKEKAVEPTGPSGLSPIEDEGKWGYRDAHGNMVIPERFQHAWPFAEGLARVRIDNKQGFIDTTGSVVIPTEFDVASDFSDGLAAAGSGKEPLKWKWGFIDKKGSFVIREQFDDARPFSEGLAAAAIGDFFAFQKDRWGYIDKSGKWVISRQFYAAHEFVSGLAPVATGTLWTHAWGYINTKGEFVIKPTFGDADVFSEDLAKVEVVGKYGYINRDGQFVIQPQFAYASAFHDGTARVVFDGKTGFVDKSGRFTPSQ